MTKQVPPRLQRVATSLLRDSLKEEVEGDLEEKFYVTLKTKSYFSADRVETCKQIN